jgi:hypothetical protein
MKSSRADRILKDWAAIAAEARRPVAPPRPVIVRSGLSGATLGGLSLVVVALVIAVVWLGRPGPGPSGVVGSSPSTLPTPTATPLTTPSPSATTAPTPSPAPTTGACDAVTLHARITLWEGAAGHRIAHLELTNTGSSACRVRTMATPQLVDGQGSVLIDGSTSPASGFLTVAPGGVLKTLVQAGNYCGPTPVPPVSVAFVLSDGGRIVAMPVSPTDATLPPCLGSGSPATVEMQPWAR